jgi:hypothetical protein
MTDTIIRETGSYLSGEQVPYLLFDIPLNVQVDSTKWLPWQAREPPGAAVDLDLPAKQVRQIAAAGATYVETVPGYRAAAATDLYFRNDPTGPPQGTGLRLRFSCLRSSC